MKPILRWTIGNVHPCGFDVLAKSVDLAVKLYPDFDRIICHNNLTPLELRQIQKMDTELIDQTKHLDDLPHPPDKMCEVAWKLFPARIRSSSHEIFIDNDIVLTDRLYEIDEFLSNNCPLLYQGLHGLHGRYEVPKGIQINSGIFGLPPGFDFKQELSRRMLPWTGRFDEQGLVAATLLDQPKHIMIGLPTVPIVEPDFSLEAQEKNHIRKGFHFARANKESHPKFYQWVNNKSSEQHCQKQMKIIL